MLEYKILIENLSDISVLHSNVRKDEKIINILESIDGVVSPCYAEDYKIIFKIGKCFDSEKINDEITRRIHEYLHRRKPGKSEKTYTICYSRRF